MLSLLVTALATAGASLFLQIKTYRKIKTMSSPEFEKLQADVREAKAELVTKNAQIAALTSDKSGLEAQVGDLTAKLAVATGGTPDADIAALDAELAPVLDPAAAPAPVPTPDPAPAPAT